MRNGNNAEAFKETGSPEVLILPMRNGNYRRLGKSGHTCLNVLILPMRNGNLARNNLYDEEDIIRSYPTYEEWKQ